MEHRLHATFAHPEPYGVCTCGARIDGPNVEDNHERHVAKTAKHAGLDKARAALAAAKEGRP
jgi:hypothetical protein